MTVKVLSEANPQDIESEVERYAGKGYELRGNVQYSEGRFVATMVDEESDSRSYRQGSRFGPREGQRW